MLLDPNGGGMALQDLEDLINRIPEHRNQLETSHTNLENVARFCENNYLNAQNKNQAFEETKQYTLQSLASVAYQINTLARDLLDMLSLQTDKISQLGRQVDSVDMIVKVHKEKMARREIGQLTTNKSIPKQPKIIAPAMQDPIVRYKRTPIDFSLLDGVGHGLRTEIPQKVALVSRASSTVSGANHYGHYGQFERTANIGNNTLSRASVRSSTLTGSGDHYRVPAVMPILDPSRYGTAMQGNSEYGSHTMGSPSIADYGSQHGSSEYGGTLMTGDRYGTLRAMPLPVVPPQEHMNTIDRRRSNSPGLPPPPMALTSNSHYGYGILSRQDLPPPSAQLLNSTHEDDCLPPPPLPSSSNGSTYTALSSNPYFDSQPDWIPREGTFIEKAVALYDYDANKPDELSLRENCVVYVLRKNDDGWFEGVLDGVTGLFPGNYVRAL